MPSAPPSPINHINTIKRPQRVVLAEEGVILLEAFGGFFGEADDVGDEEGAGARGGDDGGVDVVVCDAGETWK